MILTFCQFYTIKGFFIFGLHKIHVVYTNFRLWKFLLKILCKNTCTQRIYAFVKGIQWSFVNIMEENDPWSYTEVDRCLSQVHVLETLDAIEQARDRFDKRMQEHKIATSIIVYTWKYKNASQFTTDLYHIL